VLPLDHTGPRVHAVKIPPLHQAFPLINYNDGYCSLPVCESILSPDSLIVRTAKPNKINLTLFLFHPDLACAVPQIQHVFCHVYALLSFLVLLLGPMSCIRSNFVSLIDRAVNPEQLLLKQVENEFTTSFYSIDVSASSHKCASSQTGTVKALLSVGP